MDPLKIARVCHEVNRAYCAGLGDHSLPAWEVAPGWQVESVISGVLLALDYPNTTPEDSHNSWLGVKRQAGWKYGPIKDPEKKEHPCFVPYSELPPEQRMKDHLFLAVVRAMASGS